MPAPSDNVRSNSGSILLFTMNLNKLLMCFEKVTALQNNYYYLCTHHIFKENPVFL